MCAACHGPIAPVGPRWAHVISPFTATGPGIDMLDASTYHDAVPLLECETGGVDSGHVSHGCLRDPYEMGGTE